MQITNLHLALAALVVIALVIWAMVREGRRITNITEQRAEQEPTQTDRDIMERLRMVQRIDDYNDAASRQEFIVTDESQIEVSGCEFHKLHSDNIVLDRPPEGNLNVEDSHEPANMEPFCGASEGRKFGNREAIEGALAAARAARSKP